MEVSGYYLVSIDNGHDVLSTANSTNADLISIGNNMTRVDGCMALKLLRDDKAIQHILVINITGNTS